MLESLHITAQLLVLDVPDVDLLASTVGLVCLALSSLLLSLMARKQILSGFFHSRSAILVHHRPWLFYRIDLHIFV